MSMELQKLKLCTTAWIYDCKAKYDKGSVFVVNLDQETLVDVLSFFLNRLRMLCVSGELASPPRSSHEIEGSRIKAKITHISSIS